jgi:hypothetical protein
VKRRRVQARAYAKALKGELKIASVRGACRWRRAAKIAEAAETILAARKKARRVSQAFFLFG